MILTVTDNSGVLCPHGCGVYLEVEGTRECDGEPYPDQTVDCPNCGGKVHVTQRVVTELETAK